MPCAVASMCLLIPQRAFVGWQYEKESVVSTSAWWALYCTVLGWLCSKGINIRVGAGSAPIGRMSQRWRMGWGMAPLWPVWWLAAMQPALGLLQK